MGISSFPIPYRRFEKSKFSEVDWIPGGLLLIRKKDCLDYDYFNLPGKAYCEDLIHSHHLKKNGLKLYITNQIFFKTPVKSYRKLYYKDFIDYLVIDNSDRIYEDKINKMGIKTLIQEIKIKDDDISTRLASSIIKIL